MKYKTFIGIGLSVTALGVAAVIITRPWEILAVRARTQTVLSLVSPEQNAVVPVHASIPVVADAHSRSGIRKLSFYINDQLWAESNYDGDPETVEEIWQWTPSGEGMFNLRLQALNGLNEILNSDVTLVGAALDADVRFPYEYTSRGGETLAELAGRFQTNPDAIAGSNPSVDFGSALTPDQTIIIPVPVPNAPPTGPESGLPPVKPLSLGSGPPPGGGDGSSADSGKGTGEESPGNEGGNDIGPVSLSQVDLPINPGFEINDGFLLPNYIVDKLYLYVSIAGSAWQRIPAEDQTFLDPSPAGFDVTHHFPIPEGAGLFEPIPYVARAWGWFGPQLIYLGEQSGLFMLDLNDFPLFVVTPTRLDIIGRIRDDVEYVSEWTIPEPIPGYYQGFFQGFRWSSSLENVAGGLYQVSLHPFDTSAGLFPPGLLVSKMVPAPKLVKESSPLFGPTGKTFIKPAKFAIDFSQFIDLPDEDGSKSWLDKLIEAAKNAVDSAKGQVNNAQQLSINPPEGLVLSSQPNLNWTPNTFYVRVVPIVNKKFNTEASNTVIVRYGPPEIEPISSELGGAYEAEVVSFTPYRPVNPSYSGCMVLQQDMKFCTTSNTESFWQVIDTGEEADPVCQTTMPKGTLSCGCPGVKCESSGGGCGWNPFCHLSNWVEAGVNWVKSLVSSLVSAYNDFKDAVVGFVADLGCSALSGDANSVCKGLVNLGVDIALASMGIPPELPDFEKLMDQGLEYAFETAISQVTGCDPTCQAAIKKGLEILANPEKAFDEGLNIGVEFAKEQLEKQGIPCGNPCQNLMKDVAQGELDKGKLLDDALDEAAQEAAALITQQGYNCDKSCADLIKSQLKKGASTLNLGQNGLPNGQGLSWWEPHPLALEQPAVLTVRVTRRPETAAIPNEDLDGCGLSIYNQASNTYFGQPINGKLFEGVGVGIPALEPGNALSIPIVLNRSPWHLPESIASGSPPSAPGEATIGVLSDPFLGEWPVLYFGSSATFDLTGNFFLTTNELGSTIGLPCIQAIEWKRDMPIGP